QESRALGRGLMHPLTVISRIWHGAASQPSRFAAWVDAGAVVFTTGCFFQQPVPGSIVVPTRYHGSMAYRIVRRGLVGMGVLLGAACGGKAPADPSGVPPSSILIASAPEGFSTRHLGAPYDANFELLGGKNGRTLFPKGEVHTSAQNRLTTEFVEARDQEHFAAHASAWHLVRTQA